MLIITRKVNQAITFQISRKDLQSLLDSTEGNMINLSEVTICNIDRNKVRVGIKQSTIIKVWRKELRS